MELDLNSLDILGLIPQRPPMVMIDGILSHQGTKISSSYEVEATNIFVEEGLFSESGLLENIAQTAAAKVGLECLEKGLEIPLGFIGGINKVNLIENPKIGNKIITNVEIIQEVFNITLIKGECLVNNKPMITCEMKIVINP